MRSYGIQWFTWRQFQRKCSRSLSFIFSLKINLELQLHLPGANRLIAMMSDFQTQTNLSQAATRPRVTWVISFHSLSSWGWICLLEQKYFTWKSKQTLTNTISQQRKMISCVITLVIQLSNQLQSVLITTWLAWAESSSDLPCIWSIQNGFDSLRWP